MRGSSPHVDSSSWSQAEGGAPTAVGSSLSSRSGESHTPNSQFTLARPHVAAVRGPIAAPIPQRPGLRPREDGPKRTGSAPPSLAEQQAAGFVPWSSKEPPVYKGAPLKPYGPVGAGPNGTTPSPSPAPAGPTASPKFVAAHSPLPPSGPSSPTPTWMPAGVLGLALHGGSPSTSPALRPVDTTFAPIQPGPLSLSAPLLSLGTVGVGRGKRGGRHGDGSPASPGLYPIPAPTYGRGRGGVAVSQPVMGVPMGQMMMMPMQLIGGAAGGHMRHAQNIVDPRTGALLDPRFMHGHPGHLQAHGHVIQAHSLAAHGHSGPNVVGFSHGPHGTHATRPAPPQWAPVQEDRSPGRGGHTSGPASPVPFHMASRPTHVTSAHSPHLSPAQAGFIGGSIPPLVLAQMAPASSAPSYGTHVASHSYKATSFQVGSAASQTPASRFDPFAPAFVPSGPAAAAPTPARKGLKIVDPDTGEAIVPTAPSKPSKPAPPPAVSVAPPAPAKLEIKSAKLDDDELDALFQPTVSKRLAIVSPEKLERKIPSPDAEAEAVTELLASTSISSSPSAASDSSSESSLSSSSSSSSMSSSISSSEMPPPAAKAEAAPRVDPTADRRSRYRQFGAAPVLPPSDVQEARAAAERAKESGRYTPSVTPSSTPTLAPQPAPSPPPPLPRSSPSPTLEEPVSAATEEPSEKETPTAESPSEEPRAPSSDGPRTVYSREALLAIQPKVTRIPDLPLDVKAEPGAWRSMYEEDSSASFGFRSRPRTGSQEFPQEFRLMGPGGIRRLSPMSDRDPRAESMAREQRERDSGYSSSSRYDMARRQAQRPLITGPVVPLARTEARWEPGKGIKTELDKIGSRVRGVLNKMTLEKFETLTEQLITLLRESLFKIYKDAELPELQDASTPDELPEVLPEQDAAFDLLQSVVDQMFEKTLGEAHYSALYSDLTSRLATHLPKITPDTKLGDFKRSKAISFDKLIVVKCQEEFERGKRPIDTTDKNEEEIRELERAQKTRMLGNIRFIGELYRRGILKESIMHFCIRFLLGLDPGKAAVSDEDIESCCRLLTTVGKKLEASRSRGGEIPVYINHLQAIADDKDRFSSRIRFTCLDVVDLWKNKWEPRMVKDQAKKIEDIHKEARANAAMRMPQAGLRQLAPSGHNAQLVRGRPPAVLTGVAAAVPRKAAVDRYAAVVVPPPQPDPQALPPERRGLLPTPTQAQLMADAHTHVSGPVIGADRGQPIRLLTKAGPTGPAMLPPREEPPTPVYEPGSFDEELESRLQTLVKEWTATQDFKEARLSLEELRGPDTNWLFVVQTLNVAADMGQEAKSRLAALLVVRLFEEGIMSTGDVLTGVREFLAALPDILIDTPKAGRAFADVIAQWIAVRVIGFEWLPMVPAELVKSGQAESILANLVLALEQELGPTRAFRFIQHVDLTVLLRDPAHFDAFVRQNHLEPVFDTDQFEQHFDHWLQTRSAPPSGQEVANFLREFFREEAGLYPTVVMRLLLLRVFAETTMRGPVAIPEEKMGFSAYGGLFRQLFPTPESQLECLHELLDISRNTRVPGALDRLLGYTYEEGVVADTELLLSWKDMIERMRPPTDILAQMNSFAARYRLLPPRSE